MSKKVKDDNLINEPENKPNTGRWGKGQSGNPGGRPKIPEDIKQAFKDLTPTAVDKLKEIIESPETSDRDRLKAIEIALDRGYGKPVQAVDLDANVAPQVVFIDDIKD